jgi:hypothetical protein
MTLIEKLNDLIEQATKERSHYYVAFLVTEARDEIDRAFATLERYGVPANRAKSIANGITVLVTRMDRELEEAKRLYHELLYQVHNKIPGETRHETAKRIIKERETPRVTEIPHTFAAAERDPFYDPQQNPSGS